MRTTSDERSVFDAYAAFLSAGSGLPILRHLEMLGALFDPSRRSATAGDVPASGIQALQSPLPSSAADVEVPSADSEATPRSPPPRLSSSSPSRRRLVLVGESAAAGYLLAPDLTPASALRAVLAHHSAAAFEVVDLAAVDLSATELLASVRRAVELDPDFVVLFAGNNWPVRLHFVPPDGHLGPVEQALAFREGGVSGLRKLADDATSRISERTLTGALRLIHASCALPVVVVPEVDLVGWSRSRPVPWLAGDGVRRWHELHAACRDHLTKGLAAEALASAQRMISLDGGVCATTHRLRASALSALGHASAAREASRAEVAARAWDNEPTVPGATEIVQRILRRSTAHGALVVDLPGLFEREAGASECFLDYCHLSPRGIALLVSALAREILTHAGLLRNPESLFSTSLESSKPPPGVVARAFFLAGLSTAHWSESAGVDGRSATERMREALRSDRTLPRLLREWLATRFEPTESTIFSLPMQKLGEGLFGGLDPLWNVAGLDPDGLEALAGLTETDLADAIDRGLVGSSHDASRVQVDLLDPGYAWASPELRASSRFFGQGRRSFRRVSWPHMDTALVSDGCVDLALEITLRLPTGAGSVRVFVNDRELGTILATDRWNRSRVTLPAAALVAGLNRLRLSFPPPRESGESALARIEEALDLGRGVELHPCFGEVFRLVAGPDA